MGKRGNARGEERIEREGGRRGRRGGARDSFAVRVRSCHDILVWEIESAI